MCTNVGHARFDNTFLSQFCQGGDDEVILP